jgi:hypothetical protein
MKKWTQRQAVAGAAVEPALINDELSAQQSSITTLDRAQLPAGWVDETRLVQGALHRVWQDSGYPTTGEQQLERDTQVHPMAWISSTLQVQTGGWVPIATQPLILTGFKGGNLFVEWSCNVWAYNAFVHGLNDGSPYSPNYVRLRCVVNGQVIAERRGGAYHQTSRLIGNVQLPAGDITVSFQYQLTSASQDWAQTLDPIVGTQHTPYGHLWNSRYLIIGRHR